MNVLRIGDHGPKAVLVQLLLVTRAPHASIAIDGQYGPLTAAAVRQFQALHPDLPQNGQVDTATWEAMLNAARLATIDHVDADDLVIAMQEGNLVGSLAQGRLYGPVAAADLARAGAPAASLSVGMSNGVTQMISQIRAAAGARKIGLLRIFGHGNRGLQIVSSGHGVTGGSASHGSALTAQAVHAMPEWGVLADCFARYGSCELHGCRVGGGSQGEALLRALADLWRVPVSAGLGTQFSGRGRTARFEGAVRTAYPGGGSLRAWARNVESHDGRIQYA